jgi:hypothetical protein
MKLTTHGIEDIYGIKSITAKNARAKLCCNLTAGQPKCSVQKA